MPKHLSTALACAVFLFSVACNPAAVLPEPVLLNSVQLAYYDNATLKHIATTNDSLIYQATDYKISVNRISYRTMLADGSSVTASGIVYLPDQITPTLKPYPLLSYQHPTAFSSTEVPSGGDFMTARFSYPLYFATHGYIVACPDYVGYGDADKIPHDYQHRQSLAQATVDMLLATKAFLTKRDIQWNSQIFLAGYSEGGYASLSAQKLLEEKYAGLRIAGSSCGAGPYAMSAFFNYVTQNPTDGGVSNQVYAWQTLSYNRIYNINKPVSYFFKPPYAGQIEQSLANARNIALSFNEICTDQFLADVRNGASPFGKALADNDLTNWSVQAPTRLIHSEQDEVIPFLTSQQTYTALHRRGSPSVSLLALRTGGHVPTEVVFMSRSLSWFEQLRH